MFVLGVVGGWASGGATTSAFWWALGSQVLSYALTPTAKQFGPRLADLSIQTSDYGMPIPVVYGDDNEMAGNIIWTTGIKERVTVEHQGGKKGGGGGVEVTTYSYSTSIAIMVCEGPITRIRKIKADAETIYDAEGENPGYEFVYDAVTGTYTDADNGVTIYTGTETQLPNSTIQAAKGISRTSAYRGYCVVVLTDFALERYGNRPPIFKFQVEAPIARADHVCLDICKKVGLTEDDVDFTDIGANYFGGFTLPTRAQAKTYLEQVGQKIFCDFYEADGKIKARRRGGDSVLTITNAVVAAHNEGEDNPAHSEWSKTQELEKPRSVEVTFLDTSRDLDNNTIVSERQVTWAERKAQLSFTMAMGNSEAKRVGDIELYRQWAEGERYAISSDWSNLWLTPSDPVTIIVDGQETEVLIIDAKEEIVGLVTYTAVAYDKDIYSIPIGDDTGEYEPTPTRNYGGYLFSLIETNSARDDLNAGPGYYFWCSMPQANDWVPVVVSGAMLDPSKSLSGPQGPYVRHPHPSTAGKCQSTLPDHEGGSLHWDYESTLTIDLLRGSLSSASEDDVLNGANLALVDKEIIQFLTASFSGIVTYDDKSYYRYVISDLLRGRRGTEPFIAEHAADEYFVLLDSSVTWVPLNASAIGNDATIRVSVFNTLRNYNWFNLEGVLPFVDEDNSTSITLTVPVVGRNLKPYFVTNIEGARDGDDIAITWERRSRYSDNYYLTGIEPILGESVEKYKVQLLTDTFAVIDEWIVTEASWLATGAITTAAYGGVLPDEIYVRVYQMNEVVGEGYPSDIATLPTPVRL